MALAESVFFQLCLGSLLFFVTVGNRFSLNLKCNLSLQNEGRSKHLEDPLVTAVVATVRYHKGYSG